MPPSSPTQKPGYQYAPLKPANTTVNPFAYDTPMTKYEAAKIIFFVCSGLLLVRLLIILVVLVIAYLVSLVASLSEHDVTGTKWNAKLMRAYGYLARLILFVIGFVSIDVQGELDPKARVVTPNHVSLFDVLVVLWLTPCTFVAKAGVASAPFVGTIAKSLGVIFVDRANKGDRHKTAEAIAAYTQNHEARSPLVIFPQGTTTNMSALTMFMHGAFRPQEAVQPVVLRYKYEHWNPSFVLTNPRDWCKLRHLTQFVIKLEVAILPLHEPTADEKQDANLFAASVRQEIASYMGVPTTDHSYEDAVLFNQALKLNHAKTSDKAPKHVEFAGAELKEVKDLFAIDSKKQTFGLKNAQQVLANFIKIDKDGDGLVTIEEFAAAAGYDSDSPQTQHLFDFFDRDQTGTIDFRELIIGMALCNPYSTSEAKLRLAFDVYDRNSDGVVSGAEMMSIVREANLNPERSRVSKQEMKRVLSKIRTKTSAAPGVKDEDLVVSWKDFQQIVKEDSELVGSAISSLNLDFKKKQHVPGTDGKMDINDEPSSSAFFPFLVRRNTLRNIAE